MLVQQRYTERRKIMLRVKLESLVIDQAAGNILDIIQWVHKHNKFQKAWGISFRPNEFHTMDKYLETSCPQIMNAVSAKWPHAKIETVEFDHVKIGKAAV